MGYEGPERRQEQQIAIELLKSELSHIKEAVDKIEVHMEEAIKNRNSWWIAMAGVFVMLLVQTACFVFYLGGTIRQQEIDTKRIDRLEARVGLPDNKGYVFKTSSSLDN